MEEFDTRLFAFAMSRFTDECEKHRKQKVPAPSIFRLVERISETIAYPELPMAYDSSLRRQPPLNPCSGRAEFWRDLLLRHFLRLGDWWERWDDAPKGQDASGYDTDRDAPERICREAWRVLTGDDGQAHELFRFAERVLDREPGPLPPRYPCSAMFPRKRYICEVTAGPLSGQG